jgi:hypothetical protein
MRTTRQSLQARPKILKKILKHQINQSERSFSQKKIYLVTQKYKEPKICMGATRRYSQAQPKILKKIIGTPNLPIKTKIFPKKVCLVL